jgi:tRNA (adenine57-N1/adenine58-N1)-methyltransferase
LPITRSGDLALLVGQDDKQFIIKLDPQVDLQTHRGVLKHQDLIGIFWGAPIQSHLGYPFRIYKPSLRDLLLNIKRRSQIIFPKDIGYVLLRLSVGPGSQIVEAGTGSGALTTALAWTVGPEGRVYSYDRRQDMQELARKNLTHFGLEGRVSFRLQDIEAGFEERSIEALFLDLPHPENYLSQVRRTLIPGGVLGVLLPTTNQVSVLLAALEQQGFGSVDVCEILLRFYKTVPARLRPDDRMVAHTGYLIFARAIQPVSEIAR